MSVNDLVLVQGIRDTRRTLSTWQRDPLAVLGGWLGWSFMIALGLLASVYLVAVNASPQFWPLSIPGLTRSGGVGDVLSILARNALVLALHAMACVAGFMAGSSMPLAAESRTGFSRWVHAKAGPLAIAFVVCATGFSLVTQAYVLGGGASTLSWQLGVDPGVLLAVLAVHALPELVALFLPLAAWVVASRRGDWHELLAATFVTVAVAVPVLVVSAVVEVYLTPRLLLAIAV